jgi:hypothetical protein
VNRLHSLEKTGLSACFFWKGEYRRFLAQLLSSAWRTSDKKEAAQTSLLLHHRRSKNDRG